VRLPREGVPLARNYLWAELDLGGGRLRLVVTHLHHVEGPEGARVRLAQIPRLLEGVAGRPATVLLGDFNAEPGSREIALLRGAGLTDALPAAGGSADDEPTYSSDRPERRIDYLWLSPDLRASDFDARARGLKELQETLDLPEAPLRIECYDISNLQGNQVVGSMVVFEDGLARKSEYRRFEIRSVEGQDDVASLHEVLTRRLARLASERAEPPTDDEGKRRKFAYPPNLIVVDGGRPQLAAALEAVRASASPELPVVSLAKRMEEVYLPGSPDPVVIPRTSEALYLLQRVRDEAHRFAIGYHRKLRGRSMTRSVLDGIPGVGETRRRQLVRHFGSARKAAQASLEELEQVPGLGPQLAKVVYDHLHGGANGGAKRT